MDRKAHGFTVVELLIVVVVIAILASVSVVAYRTVTHRARVSEAMATAKQVGTKIIAHRIEHDTLPVALADIGVDESQGSTIVTYRVSPPTWWCVTVSANEGSVQYSMGSATAGVAVEGLCSAVAGAIATTTVPTVMSGVRTVAFVGSYNSGVPGSQYVFDRRAAANVYLYKTGSGNTSGNIGTYRQEGSLMIAYITASTPSAVHVGQRFYGDETWQGSFRAIGFDRELTAAEAEQVIAELRAGM